MRLQQPIFAHGRVAQIRLRVVVDGVPVSAAVLITDVQLQAGEVATGPTRNPEEWATETVGAQYRNGVVRPGMEVVALSNGDAAAPARLGVVATHTTIRRLGGFRFGVVDGDAYVDGATLAASQGYVRAPIITERSDLTMRADMDSRAHVRLAWEGRQR